MKRFHGERLQALTNRIGWEEGAALDGRLVSRSIESAQTKVERYHFEARKNVTEYDDVMNKQRQVVYNLRSRILAQDNLREEIVTMSEDLVEEAVLTICQARQRSSQWDIEKIKERFTFLCNAECVIDSDAGTSVQGVFDALRTQAKDKFLSHVAEQQAILDELRDHYLSQTTNPEEIEQINGHPQFKFETLEQNTMLEALDHFWNLHLKDMDHLREGIGLSAYGQKNPKHEYQKEGFVLFTRMLERLKESIVRTLCYGQLTKLEYQAHLEEEQLRRQEQIEAAKETHGDDVQQAAGNSIA
jgi:preprotein translocase subunit SecA